MQELQMVLESIENLGETALQAFLFYLGFKVLITTIIGSSVIVSIAMIGKVIKSCILSHTEIPSILEGKGYKLREHYYNGIDQSKVRNVITQYLPNKK